MEPALHEYEVPELSNTQKHVEHVQHMSERYLGARGLNKKVKFSNDSTKKVYSKESFVYEFLSSLRQKLNDPLGKRKTRRTKTKI